MGAALLAAACTSAEPPPPVSAEPAPQIEEASATPSEPVVEQTLPWRWTVDTSSEVGETWMPMPAAVDNGTTHVEATALEDGRVEVVQSHSSVEQWRTTIGAPHEDTAALAWFGDVLAVHYSAIASGATAVRLDRRTGGVQWETPLIGLGPIGHSKYRNAVQVELRAGQAWIYGWEAQGAYVEVLDLATGRAVQHSIVEPGLTELRWEDADPPPPREGFQLPAPWGVGAGEPPVLWSRPPGAEARSIPLPGGYGSCDTGAGLEHDGVLYLARACSMSSGARLLALSISDWEWQWQHELIGLGPIAHSAYSNRVRIDHRDGRLLVYGDEAMGRYVEAVDPASGRTLATKRWH